MIRSSKLNELSEKDAHYQPHSEKIHQIPLIQIHMVKILMLSYLMSVLAMIKFYNDLVCFVLSTSSTVFFAYYQMNLFCASYFTHIFRHIGYIEKSKIKAKKGNLIQLVISYKILITNKS